MPLSIEAAPTFSLAGPYGVPVTNGSLLGRAALLLFVPSAFTPVCTQEVREHGSLRALREQCVLVVVSCDTAHTLTKWLTQLEVSAAVGSDFWPHGEVARKFAAFDEHHGWPQRRSVLMNDHGAVVWTDTSAPGQPRDPQAAIKAVGEFGVA